MRAVIFDCDGVLVDSQPLHSAAEAALLREYGIIIDPEVITARFAGVSGRDMFPKIFDEFGKQMPELAELQRKKWGRMFDIPLDEFKEVPGTRDLIDRLALRRIPLVVASASRAEFVDHMLRAIDLRTPFKAITSSHEVARGKPAPDVFLLAAAKVGAKPHECIVIEDGVSGMIGAHKAGMRCVALDRSGTCEYRAELNVSNLQYVPDAFFD